MKIAVVLPRGSLFDVDRINSMERVALTLNAWSRFNADIRFVCEEGAANPAAPDLVIFDHVRLKRLQRRDHGGGVAPLAQAGRYEQGHTAAVVAALT